MWSVAGLVLALALASIAWFRSRTRGGHYDAAVYAMTPAVHRRYALVSLAFATFFAVTLAMRASGAGLAGLTVYALVVLLYGASFLRGAEEDDGGNAP